MSGAALLAAAAGLVGLLLIAHAHPVLAERGSDAAVPRQRADDVGESADDAAAAQQWFEEQMAARRLAEYEESVGAEAEEEERAERMARELAAIEQASEYEEMMRRDEAEAEHELELELREAARLADSVQKAAAVQQKAKAEVPKATTAQPVAVKAAVVAEPKKAAPKMEMEVEEDDNEEDSAVPQKKGQSEYVSFVEPPVSRQRQSKQSFDKRRPVESVGSRNSQLLKNYHGNIVFVAIGTLLVVGLVGTVGGTLYFRKRRESFDDSEFAPYSGSGPKMGGSTGVPKGDEALAYKAQLHHYQQAKQKIICGDDELPGVGLPADSDDEEAADDEHNFSVYECPGLAPTGDLEVHNPNFAAADDQQH